jgi:cellulose synthase/poly-beta-1,6-N-acetylglucosamine synthase-like glycosyltransferase
VLLNEGETGLCEARNLAINHAVGEIFAFVDDDVVLTPEWAHEVLRTFADPSIIALTGSAFPLWSDKSGSLPEDLDWLVSCTSWYQWKDVREVRNVWGLNMAFRREAFEKCGLFPTNLGYHRGPMSEDLGFSIIVRKATQKRIVFNPAVKVFHKVQSYRLTWAFIAERSYWTGHCRRMLKSYYPGEEMSFSADSVMLPRMVKRLFAAAFTGLREFSLTSVVLLFVTLGYLIPGIPLEVVRKPLSDRKLKEAAK